MNNCWFLILGISFFLVISLFPDCQGFPEHPHDHTCLHGRNKFHRLDKRHLDPLAYLKLKKDGMYVLELDGYQGPLATLVRRAADERLAPWFRQPRDFATSVNEQQFPSNQV